MKLSLVTSAAITLTFFTGFTVAAPAPIFATHTISKSAQSLDARVACQTPPTNAELCGARGCIMQGVDKNGRPIFGGMGCDVCYDDVPSSTPAVTTATTTITTTTTITSIAVQTGLYVTTITSIVPTITTIPTTTTITALSFTVSTTEATATVTATQYVGGSIPSDCQRIGTLDEGGPLWIGTSCKGASVYKGETGCSRGGTLDTGGAIWVGDACGIA